MTKQASTRSGFVFTIFVLAIHSSDFSRFLEKIRCSSLASIQSVACLWLQLGHRANDHAQKMFRFACFLSAGANAFAETPFSKRVIGFDVIGANTCRRADELTNDTICHGILRNLSLRNR